MTGDWLSLALKFGEIVWINLLLSGDNAIVIAMACRGLPPRSRRYGIWAGAAAAIGLRIVFTLLIVQLLQWPYVRPTGGVLLFGIAVRLVLDGDSHKKVPESKTIWRAVMTIAIADAVMSLDNVLAIAAAAHGEMTLIVLGLAMSVPLIIFGSNLVLAVIDRFPLFVWAGCALLGYVAGEIMVADAVVGEWLGVWRPLAERLAGLAGAALALAATFAFKRLRRRAEGI